MAEVVEPGPVPEQDERAFGETAVMTEVALDADAADTSPSGDLAPAHRLEAGELAQRARRD